MKLDASKAEGSILQLSPELVALRRMKSSDRIRQSTFPPRVFEPAARRAGIKTDADGPWPSTYGREPHGQGWLLASGNPGGARASHATMTDRYTHLFSGDAR
jgi:hypothetical protein